MLYLQGVAHLNFGGRGRLPISVVPNGVYQNFLASPATVSEATVWVAASRCCSGRR
jgi:hypothetical protein